MTKITKTWMIQGLLIAACSATAAHADTTVYDKVAALYAGGTIPTSDNISGVSLGRCFNATNRDVPNPGAVFFQGAKILAPEGPITGDVLAFQISFNSKIAYNGLDAINSIAVLEQTIGESLTPNDQLPPAKLDDQGLLATIKDDSGLIKNWVKLNGEYLVVKHTEPASSSPFYCYFFKKIMNP